MDITVSIVMLVYNHGRFLAQALDSVLMQKVNFAYELIVGEDCSPDNSREILKSYEEKFGPALVPLYRQKNLGSKKNMQDCMNHCRGKYIAFLEGDDFWTDAGKLQKQVDFLESHSDYTAVYSGYVKADIHGDIQENVRQWDVFHEYTREDFEHFDIPGQTGTMMISARQMFMLWEKAKRLLIRYSWIPLDRLCILFYLSTGRIGVLPDCMSAYRYYLEQNGTNWSSQHEGNAKNMLLYYYVMQVGVERFSHKLEYPVDLYEIRRGYYARVTQYKNWGIIGPRREALLKLAMMMVEPHKVRLYCDRKLLSGGES